MRRLHWALALAALFAPVTTAAQDNARGAVTETAQSRFDELSKAAAETMKSWIAEGRERIKAAREAGEEPPQVDWNQPFKDFHERFLAAAQEYAGTESAVPYLVWIVDNGLRADAEATTAAFTTIAEHHANSSGIKSIGRVLPSLKPMFEGEKAARFASYLTSFESKGTDPELRAWATFTRVEDALENAAVDTDDFKAARQHLLAAIDGLDTSRLTTMVEKKLRIRETFSIGMVAPDIEGIDLDGVAFKLSDYKDKVLFVDFWGDW